MRRAGEMNGIKIPDVKTHRIRKQITNVEALPPDWLEVHAPC